MGLFIRISNVCFMNKLFVGLILFRITDSQNRSGLRSLEVS